MKKLISVFCFLLVVGLANAQRHVIVKCYDWSYSFPNWSARIVDVDNKGNFPSSVQQDDTLYINYGTDELQRLVVSGTFTSNGYEINASGNIVDNDGTPAEGVYGFVCSPAQRLIDIQAAPISFGQSLRKWFYKRNYNPSTSSATPGQTLKWNGSWMPGDPGMSEIFDDCPGNQTHLGWEQTVSGGATTTITSGDFDADRPCVVRASTGASASTSYRQISWGNGNQATAPRAGTIFRAAFNCNTLPTGADTVLLKVGWSERGTVAVGQRGVYLEIRYLPSASAYKVYCVANTGTATQTTATDVTGGFGTLAGVWKAVEIRWTTNTSASFYLDGTLLTTISTNHPTDYGTGDRCFPIYLWGKVGVGTNAAIGFLDYIYLRLLTNRL